MIDLLTELPSIAMIFFPFCQFQLVPAWSAIELSDIESDCSNNRTTSAGKQWFKLFNHFQQLPATTVFKPLN